MAYVTQVRIFPSVHLCMENEVIHCVFDVLHFVQIFMSLILLKFFAIGVYIEDARFTIISWRRNVGNSNDLVLINIKLQ